MLAAAPEPLLDEPPLVGPEQIRRLSRREYHQLLELDWFDGKSLELRHGVLVTRHPQRGRRTGVLDPMLAGAFDPALVDPPRIRLLSRREYDRLVELGWFEDEKLELLCGVLIKTSPQYEDHAAGVVFFNKQLVLQVGNDYQVRPQLPFSVAAWSEPEPDLMVTHVPPVRRGPRRTRREHPRKAVLVVEVAASSLRIDRKLKLKIYADAGVPEYWIVDVYHRAVEVHTDPVDGRYTRVRTLRDGDLLRPGLLPQVAIRVADIPWD